MKQKDHRERAGNSGVRGGYVGGGGNINITARAVINYLRARSHSMRENMTVNQPVTTDSNSIRQTNFTIFSLRSPRIRPLHKTRQS